MDLIPSDLPTSPRSARRIRWFKRAIVLTTAGVATAMIAASAAARHHIHRGVDWVRVDLVRRVTGLEPDRAEVEAEWARRRAYSIDQTHDVLKKFYDNASEEMKALFQVAGMDPDHGLIRYGRGDQAFLVSPQVFELDDHGRSYRMRPKTRSVWLRQITLNKGPFGLFQVLDTPEHRAAAARAGAIVDEGSIQNTNSWGLRGPEPDPNAPIRGVVLGDSFMQGMFNGDADTPSVHLAKRIEGHWNRPVSIANTGHIGYSPEQYYFSLAEYGERMRPQFVVVSVCPNDFGDGLEVLAGRGDWFDEAAYWLEKIQIWCNAHRAMMVLVAIPTYVQIEGVRKEAFYPGQVCNILNVSAFQYCNPLDEFIDADLGLKLEANREGKLYPASKLYNRAIQDNHFSPRGADLWARIVARRLILGLETSTSRVGMPPAQGPRAEPPPNPIAPAPR